MYRLGCIFANGEIATMNMALLDIKNLENKRKKRGFSIAKLCSISGISESTYHRWLKSKHNPNIKTLNKIERTLKNGQSDSFKRHYGSV